ncbi:hypothetical protein BH23CHL1_BH23CHL1_27110 [soil metagenome]
MNGWTMASDACGLASREHDKLLRILVANEPQSYRDVLSSALHVLLPEYEVRAALPAELDREVDRFQAHVVICSRLSEAVRAVACAWVLLYPGGQAHAVVSIDGREQEVSDIELAGLLSVIDAARLLI